jgi:hypothetical protein
MKKHFSTKKANHQIEGWGRGSSMAEDQFKNQAEQIMHDFLIDELSQEYYDQLRYEAACVSLKTLRTWMNTIEGQKKFEQAERFYQQKLAHLQGMASQYNASPYCL